MARLKERYQKEVAPAIAKEFGIETRVIPLSSEVINTIKEAQVKTGHPYG